MKLSFVCLSVYPVAATGLLLWAQRAEDIGRLLHGWRAGGQQQPLHNGGECGQCHVARRRRKLNTDLSRISQSAVLTPSLLVGFSVGACVQPLISVTSCRLYSCQIPFDILALRLSVIVRCWPNDRQVSCKRYVENVDWLSEVRTFTRLH